MSAAREFSIPPLVTPRAFIFDWDNTLVDTWPVIHSALNSLMREMNHPEWTMNQTRANIKKSMRDAFPQMFGDRWEEASAIYQKAYRAIHLQDLRPLPDAEALLQSLKQRGIFIAAVSNKRGDNLRKEIDHLGWTHYFDAIVGSGDAAIDKPDPAPVIMALQDSGVSAGASVWFIGDTTIDLECAKNTGCTPILYGDVESDGKVYEGCAISHHARDHAGLLAFINEWLP